MPPKSKNYKNKTSEEIEEIRRNDRERKRIKGSCDEELKDGLEELRKDETEYVVVEGVLRSYKDRSYKNWKENNYSIPAAAQWKSIQLNNGRKFCDIGEGIVYRNQMYPGLANLERSLQRIFPDRLHSLKYLKSEPGTLAQQFHTDHPEPDRFVVFGGIESNSALAVFNKKKKAIEIVEYKRGDILIIKSTTIHAGWYNNSDQPHYRILIEIGNTLLAQAGHKQLTYYTINQLQEVYGAPRNVAKALGSSEYLKTMLQ
ncbi:hypothetical protein MP638_006854 [Amoeboaphelidium occidentale]|nr:hypothetical protein MP638_006854 [Amoeboaphelidium occidentale]